MKAKRFGKLPMSFYDDPGKQREKRAREDLGVRRKRKRDPRAQRIEER